MLPRRRTHPALKARTVRMIRLRRFGDDDVVVGWHDDVGGGPEADVPTTPPLTAAAAAAGAVAVIGTATVLRRNAMLRRLLLRLANRIPRGRGCQWAGAEDRGQPTSLKLPPSLKAMGDGMGDGTKAKGGQKTAGNRRDGGAG